MVTMDGQGMSPSFRRTFHLHGFSISKQFPEVYGSRQIVLRFLARKLLASPHGCWRRSCATASTNSAVHV